MNINEYAIITNHSIGQAFENLTENNFHNDTSIFNCYLAFGIVPPDKKEYQMLWGILDGLKEIDRKNYIQGFLRFDDLEKRAALDQKLEKIIRKYI